MIAGAEVKHFWPFEHDAFALATPAGDLRKCHEQCFIRLHAFGCALPGAEHLGRTIGQGAGLDLHGRIRNLHTRPDGPTPQIDPGVAVRLDTENWHPFSRPHWRGVEQKFLVEGKRIRRKASAA